MGSVSQIQDHLQHIRKRTRLWFMLNAVLNYFAIIGKGVKYSTGLIPV
jgi:hypothetical protein